MNNIYVGLILGLMFGTMFGYAIRQPECDFNPDKAVKKIEQIAENPMKIPYARLMFLDSTCLNNSYKMYQRYKPPSEYLLRLMVIDICQN